MFINNLLYEKQLLQNIQKHHFEKLYAPGNPSGILLCQKHLDSFRWRRRYLQAGRPVTTNLHKTEKGIAEKLAVNLYRIICIQYLQSQIGAIDNILRQFGSTDYMFRQPGSTNNVLRQPGSTNNVLRQPGSTNNTLKHQIPDDPADSLQGDFPTMPDFQNLFRGLHSRPLVPADFFDLKSPYRQFILSHLQNEYSWIIDWYLTDYEKNTDHPEQLIFPVKLGFNVRSKSEVLIADRLYEEGILLHYEEKLFLSDHSCRPDFNLPITLYEKYKWEHFGAMDKSFYFNTTRGKILAYLDNQMFPGINMLTTYETKQNPLTEEQVDYVITWLKRRYRLAFPDMPPDKSFNMYDLAAYVRNQRGQQ